MTDQEIFEKIEKTYATDGGKKFITHLIRSFFPVDKYPKIEYHLIDI